MKLFRYIASAFIALALAAGFTACSDDDTLLPVDTPTAGNADASYSSLTFRWNKVDGANQYGYTLTGPTGVEITTDVTNTNSATFTGLTPDTEYTLKVWAYGAYGVAGTSDVTTLTMRTLAVETLATPVLTLTDGGTAQTVSWEAIPGAKSYSYTITSTEGYSAGGTTTSTSVIFRSLNSGTYTVSVAATTTTEGYADSETATIEFTITRVQLWSANGTYTSSVTGNTYNATLCAYEGNVYVIKSWHGVEGYDLEFRISTPETDGSSYDEEDIFIIPSSLYDYDSSEGSYIVPTGLSSPESVLIYPWWNYSYMEGGISGGEIFLYNCTSYDYDSFQWGGLVESICGDWKMSTSGYQWLEDEDDYYSYTFTSTITKVSDTEVSVCDLYWEGYPVTGTVDLKARTITFPAGQTMGYYKFGTDDSDTEGSVVATISEDFNTITMTGFNFWWSGWSYLEDAKAVWTR